MQIFERPSRDDTLLAVAYNFAERSTCARKRVGTVLSIDGRVLAVGYNGAPVGMKHCEHKCWCVGAEEQYGHMSDCGLVTPCTIAVHAEANAIVSGARHGVMLLGSECHTTLSPCLACASLFINVGIVKVTYADSYRDNAGLELLRSAGIELSQVDYQT